MNNYIKYNIKKSRYESTRLLTFKQTWVGQLWSSS